MRKSSWPLPNRRWGALAVSVLLFSLQGYAQSYSVDWSTVDGGGGISTGGVYTVNGTIGQPDAGNMSGGNFAVQGGFWSALSLVQTPGAPPLSIMLTTNSVVVSWPLPATGWTLQQNTGSLSSSNWTDVTSGIQDVASVRVLIVTPPTGERFYRLKREP
jgi:hypothetical protein